MKMVQVGYGHDGRGGEEKGGYTYLVNNSVRKEQVMQVIAHASRGVNNRAFVTTGKVLGSSTRVVDKDGNPVEIPEHEKLTKAYTQKELGVYFGDKEQRTAQTRERAVEVYNKEVLGGLTGDEAGKKLAITGGTKTEKLMSEGYESYSDYMKRTDFFHENKGE